MLQIQLTRTDGAVPLAGTDIRVLQQALQDAGKAVQATGDLSGVNGGETLASTFEIIGANGGTPFLGSQGVSQDIVNAFDDLNNLDGQLQQIGLSVSGILSG